MSLPAFSVRNAVLVNMLMLVMLAVGIVFAITLPREMFPESRPDKLMVSAVYPGVQPEDVEKAVTVRIEEALRGLEGIDTVESQVAERHQLYHVDHVSVGRRCRCDAAGNSQ